MLRSPNLVQSDFVNQHVEKSAPRNVQTPSNYSNPFTQVKSVQRKDKSASFSLDRLFLKFKSSQSTLTTKIEIIETLLSYLVDNDPKNLLKLF